MQRVLIFALLLTAASSTENATVPTDEATPADVTQGQEVAEATAEETGETVEEAEAVAAETAAGAAGEGTQPSEADTDAEAAAADVIDAADGALQANVNSGCFYPGIAREDFSNLNLVQLSGQANKTDTPELCQAECANVEACKYFTWWNNSNDCFLDTADSIYAANPWMNGTVEYDGEWADAGSVAGPKVCPTFTEAPTPAPEGMPWWAWLLIVLGVVGVVAGIAYAFMPKKEAPKKKKTRAIKPAPVETKTEPVPTYTRVIHTDGRQEQVSGYAPPAGSIYAGNVVVPGRV